MISTQKQQKQSMFLKHQMEINEIIYFLKYIQLENNSK